MTVESQPILFNNVERSQTKNSRYGRLLTAIGNSEPKALIMLLLNTNGPLTAHYLHTSFQESTDGVWKMNPKSQVGYCDNTLIPAGLVELSPYNEYLLTEEGKKYGVPVASFLINQSQGLDFSLSELFGPSHTKSENSSPLNRATILKALSGHDGYCRELDLEKETGISRKIIGPHLKALVSLGVIEYRSVDFEGSGNFFYEINPRAQRNSVERIKGRQTLTDSVADLLFQMRRVDSGTICEALRVKSEGLSLIIPSLSHIGQVLSALERQGICKREIFKSGNTHSQVLITELGKKIVKEIIEPIEKSLSGDPDGDFLLEQWRKLEWKGKAQEVIEKYCEHSAYVHGVPRDVLKQQVLDLIKEYPGIRPGEITKILGGRRPFDILILLGDEKLIRHETKGKKARYYPILNTG